MDNDKHLSDYKRLMAVMVEDVDELSDSDIDEFVGLYANQSLTRSSIMITQLLAVMNLPANLTADHPVRAEIMVRCMDKVSETHSSEELFDDPDGIRNVSLERMKDPYYLMGGPGVIEKRPPTRLKVVKE